jgi:hypothetical protein
MMDMSGFLRPAAERMSTTPPEVIALETICLMAVSISSRLFPSADLVILTIDDLTAWKKATSSLISSV